MNSGMSVADVMKDQVVAVRERAGFEEIVAAMRRLHISSMPVIDSKGRVIGLISNYDLLCRDELRRDEKTYQAGRAGEPGDGGKAPLGRLVRRTGRWLRHTRRRVSRPGAGRLATELMSSPAITVTPATPAREAVRAMYRHRVHQLPVVDATTGRLTGIITRSDLLAVYERPDEDIRREILHDIIERTLGLAPGDFDVRVVSGIVTIRGRLERRSAALRLADAVAHLGGVITVVDHLTYRLDDTIASMPI